MVVTASLIIDSNHGNRLFQHIGIQPFSNTIQNDELTIQDPEVFSIDQQPNGSSLTRDTGDEPEFFKIDDHIILCTVDGETRK